MLQVLFKSISIVIVLTSMCILSADWIGEQFHHKIIAYEGYDAGESIYVLDIDRSLNYNLTHHPASDVKPSWSPDGKWLAFSSNRDGHWDIYRIHANGSQIHQLTANNRHNSFPVWSPDGTQIAYISWNDTSTDIFVINADGSTPRNVTNNQAWAWLADPTWSPDGQYIAYGSDEVEYGYGNFELRIVAVDGSSKLDATINGGIDAEAANNLELTNNSGKDVKWSWSPDGEWIVYDSFDSNSQVNSLYQMHADGKNITRLTSPTFYAQSPVWSPTGESIAFTALRGDNLDIVLLDIQSKTLRRLTHYSGADIAPLWSPDGSHLAFLSNRGEGGQKVYIMEVASGDLQVLDIRSLTHNLPIVWRP